ncbi:NADPH--cytochrome P450 reductase [Tetranychus urticae]|uniref:NADPH--cytochrome P450 reductase n=1 Tax=Tetranychus urticae TaxID=32264 RepID=T1KRF9_TETUR|nr:NADPH--cytochrome P450 reductase [Tetranychus urticae]XP_015789613.1 NADPH--cytochrome P450 reductase [Tetranychus urticae]XP_025017519.1 NADPH--cytochrome P450 reductase [Tetranychus urticae]
MEESPNQGSIISFEVFLTLVICGLGAYYYLTKRKSNEFDTKSIKSFTVDTQPNRSNSISDSGFVNKMKSTGRNIVVFYGSQTGTAEEFAVRLAKESARYGMKALVADPEECDIEELTNLNTLPNSLAIFCVATYGEGDPTDNALDLNEWLQNTTVDLNGLNYAVFGLGNKTYEHFNAFGKYIDKRLAELGANRVHELGMGDDDANIEEDFITWKEQLWSSVCSLFNVQLSGEDINLRQYELEVHNDLPKEAIYVGEIARLGSYRKQRPPFDAKNPFLAPIVVNRELYKGDRSCMHVEFDLVGSKIRYEAGDHLAIYPQNDSSIVNKLGELLKVDLDTVISLKNVDEDSSKKNPFPCPCSYRTALTHYVDICHTPRTHVLKELADYATNEADKEMLKKMSSSTDEGKALYSEWIIKSARSIVHVLEDLPSCKIPLDHLLEFMPRLQPRYYSISSSPKINPERVSITAVLVEYKSFTGRIVRGVTTGWLKTMDPNGNHVAPCFVRRSQFKLPTKSQVPILMIGPGTGLAPFMGFIQERQWMLDQGKPLGEAILYYGCRKQAEDYLYEQELAASLKSGALTKLYAAFSRDQPEKVYVTHLLKQNKKELWNLIEEKKGHIYICGDARNMARDVRDIILSTIMEESGKTSQEADAYIKRMEVQRRYSADVWS